MKKVLMLVCSATLLSACGGLLSSKKAPDEMAVIEGPSLSLPPKFELRPPLDSAEYRRQLEAQRAQQILTGSSEIKTPATGPDAWLVQKAGGDSRDPSIRQRLEKDFEVKVEEDKKGWFGRQKDIIFGSEEEEAATEGN